MGKGKGKQTAVSYGHGMPFMSSNKRRASAAAAASATTTALPSTPFPATPATPAAPQATPGVLNLNLGPVQQTHGAIMPTYPSFSAAGQGSFSATPGGDASSSSKKKKRGNSGA